MAVITFQGSVQNGQVRLADDIILPESTKVFVIVPDREPSPNVRKFDLADMNTERSETMLLSEPALAKDWLRSEEDAA